MTHHGVSCGNASSAKAAAFIGNLLNGERFALRQSPQCIAAHGFHPAMRVAAEGIPGAVGECYGPASSARRKMLATSAVSSDEALSNAKLPKDRRPGPHLAERAIAK